LKAVCDSALTAEQPIDIMIAVLKASWWQVLVSFVAIPVIFLLISFIFTLPKAGQRSRADTIAFGITAFLVLGEIVGVAVYLFLMTLKV
jgi:hypothetical protein